MKKNKKKSGFTLIEFLAVIVVLAIVAGFGISVGIKVIRNSKEKSYQVTINNIEKDVGNYLIENSDRLFYVSKSGTADLEYQCVTVRDLYEAGYFKSDVLDSAVSDEKNVSLDDYVYIERNVNTKTIVKTQYLLDSDSMCENAINASGDVSIVISPTGWSSYKEITLRYKVKNYYNAADYTYHYSFDGGSVQVISDNGVEKKLKVTNNGKITGFIKEKGSKTIVTNSKDITNIDKTPPVINVTDIIKIYGSDFDIYEGVTFSDNSGLEVKSEVYLSGVQITDSKALKVGDNTVTYVAYDKFGNKFSKSRIIKLVVADKEFNYLEKDQIYPVEASGTYIIEAYGAQGGNSGGKGGYVKAEVTLNVGDQLIINTGGVNGYNGGGGYGNSSYNSGGGASTVKYNNNLIVIAAGGGGKGNSGTAGDGGSGTGSGGANVGVGAGLSGSNGGGGSNSLNYSYNCNCQTCGGECTATTRVCDTCHGVKSCNCTTKCVKHYRGECAVDGWSTVCSTCSYPYDCNCSDECTSKNPTYECNCKTCTDKGKSGSGGSNSVKSPAISIESLSGNRSSNGYVKVSYKLVD